MRLFEEAFHMHQRGRLEDEIWEPMALQLTSILAAPSVRFVWEARGSYYSNQFQTFIDELPESDYDLGEGET